MQNVHIDEFWSTMLGAAIGVIAGIFIQYFLTLMLEKRSKVRQKNALTKEFVYNRSLTDELMEEVQNLRNAANGGIFDKYFGYFQSSKALFVQANASAASGTLYEFFSTDEIRYLQKVVTKLSVGTENWTNGEITRRRNDLLNSPNTFDKTELINFVNFLQKDFTDTARLIDILIKKLS